MEAVERALAVIDADRMAIEEALGRHSEKGDDGDIAEIRCLLTELDSIRQSLHPQMNSTVLVATLNALVEWQQCVLNNWFVVGNEATTADAQTQPPGPALVLVPIVPHEMLPIQHGMVLMPPDMVPMPPDMMPIPPDITPIPHEMLQMPHAMMPVFHEMAPAPALLCRMDARYGGAACSDISAVRPYHSSPDRASTPPMVCHMEIDHDIPGAAIASDAPPVPLCAAAPFAAPPMESPWL